MARTTGTRAGRTLLTLAVLVVLLFGTIAAGVKWSNASWAPKLALDLAGGTQIVLTPKVEPGQGKITTETINDAIAIIRQRVDSTGVSEASVSSQGGQNIVVELPGDPEEQRKTAELVRQSAQMRFRPVLVEQPVGAASAPGGAATPAPGGAATPAPSGEATPAPSGEATPAPGGGDSVAPAPTESTNGRAVPRGLLAGGTAAPAPSGDAPPAPGQPAEGAATPAPTPAATPSTAPTNASDLAWITPDVAAAFSALDCTNPQNLAGGIHDDVTKPLVTCSQDGSAKYILGPVEVEGRDIKSASAGLVQNAQGFNTGEWGVDLTFDAEGSKKFREVTERITGAPPPTNQFAIVLDGLVISAPRSNQPITDGRAQITGNFTQESATELANQLKFGALPISFQVQTEEQISALLGAEQLRNGLLAGVIGLVLVFIYSLLQYRALGFVTILSLLVAAGLTYGVILLMGWYQGYRLSLPGVAGLIVAIGVTADSFIVYFERIRDELREGRPLVSAVENGWNRARRTIIVSDCANFLAAIVLYLLAVGGVRGFAFTLGLTTIIDLMLVMMFTHPMMALLARTEFFAGGHRFSGLSPKSVGRSTLYAGRGRVRTPAAAPVPVTAAKESDDAGLGGRRPGELVSNFARPRSGRLTIAERKAAQARAAQEDDAPAAVEADDSAKED
ncbi:MAG: protein translocase subunit SecD [Actinomycetes bacterium]